MSSEAKAIVITPTLNERENIAPHIHDVFGAVPEASMLVVDDGSDDGTAEEVKGLRARFPRLHLLARSGRPSFAGSYRDGFEWAIEKGFSFLVSMDADRSHPADAIPMLLRAAEEADLVVGSRYVQGVSVRNWPLHRVLISALANRYARAVTSLPCSDLTSGFCLYRAQVARSALSGGLFSSGYACLIETKYRAWLAGARLDEVPYTFTERRLGTSKLSWTRLLEGIVAPWWCRLLIRADRARPGHEHSGE
jgi:dolichol-phosphate mannosyltransferase